MRAVIKLQMKEIISYPDMKFKYKSLVHSFKTAKSPIDSIKRMKNACSMQSTFFMKAVITTAKFLLI